MPSVDQPAFSRRWARGDFATLAGGDVSRDGRCTISIGLIGLRLTAATTGGGDAATGDCCSGEMTRSRDGEVNPSAVARLAQLDQ